jgi:tungstate transport system permease protein
MNPFSEAFELLTSGDLYVWEVILRSLRISGLALFMAVIIGLPIGAAIGLSRFRYRRSVVALMNTGLALPPVVVGLAVFLMLSRSGPLGGLELLYSPTAVILAQAVIERWEPPRCRRPCFSSARCERLWWPQLQQGSERSSARSVP